MTFTNPEVFWLLPLIAVAGFILYRSYFKSRGELIRIGGAWRGHRLASIYLLKSFFSGLFLLLSFFFIVVAWAGPSLGSVPVEEPQDGLDVAFCIDVSRSMTATDARPSRLDQAREAARFLIRSFPNTRFSLVAFKGIGVTQTPLTPDNGILEHWVDDLSPDIMTFSGTNMESGIREALRTVDFPTARHKSIILISDGESREGDVLSAARLAAAKGIEIFTLGVGTIDGTTISINGTVLNDDFGFPVQTRLNEGVLQTVARESGGKYFGSPGRAELHDLQGQLTSLANPAARGGVKLQDVPRYRIFLFLALGAFAGFLFIRIIPWRGIF